MRNVGLSETSLNELLRPKEGGAVVNPHVMHAVLEPKPDYAAMQKVIDGNTHEKLKP